MDASFTKQASDAKQFKPGIDQIYLKHSPGFLDSLVSSMSRRCQTCVNANGDNTRY